MLVTIPRDSHAAAAELLEDVHGSAHRAAGLIGVVAALLVFQSPLGFVAILGVTALCGMILRNSVILVDQIREELELGLDPWNAVLEAAVHRTRPVMLTAAATVLAMIPLDPQHLLGTYGHRDHGGLTVATLLTIFFVPALYVAWFRVAACRRSETFDAGRRARPGLKRYIAIARGSRPSTFSAMVAMESASSPAVSYMRSGLSCAIKISGSTIDLTFNDELRRPASASSWST
jgi:hypothetical protein